MHVLDFRFEFGYRKVVFVCRAALIDGRRNKLLIISYFSFELINGRNKINPEFLWAFSKANSIRILSMAEERNMSIDILIDKMKE